MSKSTAYFEWLSQTTSHTLSLAVRWNGVRIFILFRWLKTCAGSNSKENSFIADYNRACQLQDEKGVNKVAEDMVKAVADIGREQFDVVAPVSTAKAEDDGGGDLDTFLFPREYAFAFRTSVRGVVELEPEEAWPTDRARARPPPFEPPEGCTLPPYSTKDIRVCQRLGRSGCVARVQVDGREPCTKAGATAQREVEQFRKIADSDLAATLRVPQLVGFIHTHNNAKLVGFLQEYVPGLRTLGSIETPSDVALQRRRKWAVQVRETVDPLRSSSVVWGGTPDHVLVHRDSDEAWVVGFGGGGGGAVEGDDVDGTVEGDDAAVGRIHEHLGLTPL